MGPGADKSAPDPTPSATPSQRPQRRRRDSHGLPDSFRFHFNLIVPSQLRSVLIIPQSGSVYARHAKMDFCKGGGVRCGVRCGAFLKKGPTPQKPFIKNKKRVAYGSHASNP
jgi:hypothetical protein